MLRVNVGDVVMFHINICLFSQLVDQVALLLQRQDAKGECWRRRYFSYEYMLVLTVS